MVQELAGGVAAVTGGARGIGRATAAALVAAGLRVAIGDVDVATAQATAAELGGGTIALPLDVTDRGSFTAFVDAVEERLGPLTVLVNNAGIMPLAKVRDETDAAMDRIMAINVRGVMLGTKIAVDRMVPRGRGHVVNIASTAGKAGFAGGATYCASKFAVVGFCEAVRGELKGTGVEISCVMPAIVNTELAAGLHAARGIRNVDPEDVAAEIVAALRKPRLQVFVPKLIGPINGLMAALPVRAKDAIAHTLHADTALASYDGRARAGYEARAAGSGPALHLVADEPVQAEPTSEPAAP